jgi:two-component system response regulator FixJ
MNNQLIVHIVDDDAAIRSALSFLLKTEGLPTKVYASAEEFLDSVSPTTRGCLVLDVRMPGLSGLDLQQLLREKQLTLPLIIMTGYADVPMAVQAMKAGAVDFIEKPFENDRLLGLVHLCLKQSERAQSEQLLQEEVVQRIGRLTKREREVMDMLVEGLQNRVIASKLGISPRTVEIHRAHMMEKLEAHSLSDVVRIALKASTTQEDIAP